MKYVTWIQAVACACACGAFGIAQAQCTPQWDTTLGSPVVIGGNIYASAMFDDGTGSALYVGGDFVSIGGTAANGIAKYDGSQWHAVGGGTQATGGLQRGTVYALTVFDPDGPGPIPAKLIVGGDFDFVDCTDFGVGLASAGVAAWTGQAWEAMPGLAVHGGIVGSSDGIRSLAVYDNGAGPRVFACGNFGVAGGVSGIAQWDGFAWQNVGGTGISDGYASALKVHTDSAGTNLYVGGTFTGLIAVPGTPGIARWNGTSWSSVGGGNGSVDSFVEFDPDGPGASPTLLYAVSGGGLRAWNGSTWGPNFPIPNVQCPGPTLGVTVFNDGSGDKIYVGGNNCGGGTPFGTTRLTKFDGTSFSLVGDDIYGGQGNEGTKPSWITHLGVYSSNGVPTLFAGGYFLGTIAAPTQGLLQWTGSNWTTFGPWGGASQDPTQVDHLPSGWQNGGYALGTFDLDGAGPQPRSVVAAGYIYAMGGAHSPVVARNGSGWTSVGGDIPGVQGVQVVHEHTSGSTSDLYVSAYTNPGQAAGVYKLNANTWQPVGTNWGFTGSVAGYVRAMVSTDLGLGTKLYAFGRFEQIDGSPIRMAAMLNGSSWVAVGSGPAGSAGNSAHTAEAFNDGTGNAIFVAGDFSTGGRVQRWNGTTWSNASAGLPSQFAEPTLFAMRNQLFGWYDGSMYKWSGASWSLVATAPSLYEIRPIGVADPGNGERFYLAATDIAISYWSVGVLSFDGTSFTSETAMGRFTNDAPLSCVSLSGLNGNEVWFGGPILGAGASNTPGTLWTASAIASGGIARWYCPAPLCPADLDNGGGTGVRDGGVDINDLLYFLVQFEAGNAAVDLDNGTFTGTPDWGVDINDLLYFLVHFEVGC